jgi:hypothetical protein
MTTVCNDEGPNSYDKNNKIPRKHELPSLSLAVVERLESPPGKLATGQQPDPIRNPLPTTDAPPKGVWRKTSVD